MMPVSKIRASDQHNTGINNHFSGVRDGDLFWRTVHQNAALQARMITLAHRR